MIKKSDISYVIKNLTEESLEKILTTVIILGDLVVLVVAVAMENFLIPFSAFSILFLYTLIKTGKVRGDFK